MYAGLQCTSCAARYNDDQQAEYKEHLDWHFRQNKRHTQDAKVVRHRKWFYDLAVSKKNMFKLLSICVVIECNYF